MTLEEGDGWKARFGSVRSGEVDDEEVVTVQSLLKLTDWFAMSVECSARKNRRDS